MSKNALHLWSAVLMMLQCGILLWSWQAYFSGELQAEPPPDRATRP